MAFPPARAPPRPRAVARRGLVAGGPRVIASARASPGVRYFPADRIICDTEPISRPSVRDFNKPTTAFRAAIDTARLAYIMRVTSDVLVVARAACGLCLKDTCMDERDDCERVGADLQ